MSFLNPLMLIGISAIAVPIIIHFLNRRKFKTIIWAAMKFVKLSVDQNQRRMRLEDLILLLIRCALLALLAFAVHLPVYGMSWFPEEPEEPVIDVPDGAVSFIAIGDTGTGE